MTLHRRSALVARWSELLIATCLIAIFGLVALTVGTGLALPERLPYVVVTYGEEPSATEPG